MKEGVVFVQVVLIPVSGLTHVDVRFGSMGHLVHGRTFFKTLKKLKPCMEEL
jgi:hypothetical protein